MDFRALENLEDKCDCPICLDFLEDTRCGHHCHACLSLFWNDLEHFFPCPVCQAGFPQRSFSRNHQLCYMTEIISLLQKRQSKRKRQEEHMTCQKHDQPLVLFCMKDLDVLCTQCGLPVKHQGHDTCPIKKAGSYYRKILERTIETLKCKMKGVKKSLALQRRRVLELRGKNIKEYKRNEISCQFGLINLFLKNEHKVHLNEIHIEELVGLSELNEYLNTLSGHVSTAKDLLKEVEAIHEGSDVTLLTSTLRAYHRQNLRHPKLVIQVKAIWPRSAYRHSILAWIESLSNFRKM